jgi:DNA-binding MarR family transcriptional regulator
MSKDEDPKHLDPSTRAILSHWRDAVPNDRLAHLIRDVARGLTRGLQFRLSKHGISFGHWAFLRILWERDGLTQRELSVEAGLMEPTTHSAIQKMEKLGFVTRKRQDGDRKRQHIYLTSKGASLRDHLVPLAQMVNAKAVDGVSESDIEITRRTLLAMIQNLADDEAWALEAGLRITATRDLAVKSSNPE